MIISLWMYDLLHVPALYKQMRVDQTASGLSGSLFLWPAEGREIHSITHHRPHVCESNEASVRYRLQAWLWHKIQGIQHHLYIHEPYLFSFYLCVIVASMRTRIWARSRRPNVSVRGGWPTTRVNACACGTSTRPLRSWVTCVSCTWRARSHKPNCWCYTRLWRWSSAWNNKSEVSASLLSDIQFMTHSFIHSTYPSSVSYFSPILTLLIIDSHREEPEP